MARFKRNKPGRLIRYVPEVDDNRQRSTDEQIVVWIRAQSERQRRELSASGSAHEVLGDPKDPTGMKFRFDAGSDLDRQHRAIELCVEKVDNYEAEYEDGEIFVIATGKDLADHGEPSLVFEVANKILLRFDGDLDLEKKQDALPSSSPVVTQASDGIVENVEKPDLTQQETVTEMVQAATT